LVCALVGASYQFRAPSGRCGPDPVCPPVGQVAFGTRCSSVGLSCNGYCPSSATPNGVLECVDSSSGPLWQRAPGSCGTPPRDGGVPQTCSYTNGTASVELPG